MTSSLTMFGRRRAPVSGRKALAPTLFERLLGVGAALLLLVVVIAILRGRADWINIDVLIWAHLAMVMVALLLTPILLWGPRGDGMHRFLGWIWSGAMVLAALFSLGVRNINHGGFGPIHVLSVLVLVAVPLAVIAARRHNIAKHRRSIRALVIGGLLTAGLFTFPFGRMLGHWLLG